jgi:DNA polymerase-3 subunit epsilon/CBS domain-containing protein
MDETYNSTPLAALRGLVFDTETTGLDPAKARIVEIGALLLEAGTGSTAPGLDALVDPGEAVPATAARIHGITSEVLRGAPAFKEVAPQIAALLGQRVLIGHNIGFDLALLEREHNLAGLPWRAPRAIDVRILARLVAPSLASDTLDALAEWLGVEVRRRHRAMGDAETTAAIFLKLVPRLKATGIRTLAEAQAASRKRVLSDGIGQGAGWADLSTPSAHPPVIARIDSYPYRHRIADVMAAPAVALDADRSLEDGLDALIERRISSVLVRTSDGRTGLVTERDVLRALARRRRGEEIAYLGSIMSHPLETVRASDLIYRAIARMDRLNLRHLPVVDETGGIVGMVTPRNLLRQRAGEALALRDSLDRATKVEDLARNWSRVPEVARSLAAEEVDPRLIAKVISEELSALTARAAQIAEHRLAGEGQASPPVAYAVLLLGSGGRGESLIGADQDNAIVYASGEPDGPEDRYFAALGSHMADILDEIGIPLCKGGVMAKNAAWRQSLESWRATIGRWVRRSSPQDLLSIDIFFDAIAVHGDQSLARSVLDQAREAARAQTPFVKSMLELARDWSAPVTFFGHLKVEEDGRVDLKKGGLMPIFTAARALAIRHGIAATSTRERLEAVRDLGIGSPADLDAAIAAQRTLLGVILEQQLADSAAGVQLSNRVDVARIGKTRARHVKAALDAVTGLLGVVSEGRM